MNKSPQIKNNEAIPAGKVIHEANSFRRMLYETCEQLGAWADGWSREIPLDSSGNWLLLQHSKARVPEQGWKLHVSSSIFFAEKTLQRVLPVLLSEPLSFKIAASESKLNDINSGLATLSQIGKFITVYPINDIQSVRLAVALDDATRDIPGPDIPTDRPLSPGSRVYYRYGGFKDLTIQNKLGEILPAIRTPSGELVPDKRDTFYKPPEWADDPFIKGKIAKELPQPSPLVGQRYLIVGVFHQSIRGKVYLAVDIKSSSKCILKQASAEVQVGKPGLEPSDYLHNEAKVLELLAPDSRFPSPIDLVEQDSNLYLVMEYIAGETLEQHVIQHARLGSLLPNSQVIKWGRELAAMLAKIHSVGLVYRDLKSTNIIVSPEESLRLIDFEIACKPGSSTLAGIGTRGYKSHQQDSGKPPSKSDDVYSFGATLAYISTAAEPSNAPKPFSLLDRQLSILNPKISLNLLNIITQCLDPDPTRRFPTMLAVDAALSCPNRTRTRLQQSHLTGQSLLESVDDESFFRRCSELARRIGDSICAQAEHLPDDQGVTWVSTHPLTVGMHVRDLNTGTAGTTLVLAELVDEFGVKTHREYLINGLRWLENAHPPGGQLLPGLYVGEAGIGATLLRSGQVLNNVSLIEAAEDKGFLVASMPYGSPDLFNGTAGRLRFHLLLWDETKKSEHLAHAKFAGEVLLEMAEMTKEGFQKWIIPEGYGGLSGNAYLGYAHGAAGIADVLLDLFEVTGDDNLFQAAKNVYHWLRHMAVPALDDGSGLNWPSIEGEPSAAAYWCHGAGGISRFLLHAAKHNMSPDAKELAMRSLRTVSLGTRWAGPVRCHGLAGSIDALLDAYQETSDRNYFIEAQTLSRLLDAFSLERNGLLFWESERPGIITPDYMVGYAGIATTLLRLANPENRPDGLSRQGFRYRSRIP